MALGDGALDRAGLLSVVQRVQPTFAHLLIDACHSEGVVMGRGMFAQEREGKVLDAAEVLSESLPANVGVILSATSATESFEWSRVESGVFTHEVLSGLLGGADVNMDGRIEYSELQAFVAAANRTLPDPRAAPNVVIVTPRANRRVALVVYDGASQTGVLQLGGKARVSVEQADGERLADLHYDGPIALHLPSNTRLFVRTGDRESTLTLRQGERALATQLSSSITEVAARGAMSDGLERHLFETAFGWSYYSATSTACAYQVYSASKLHLLLLQVRGVSHLPSRRLRLRRLVWRGPSQRLCCQRRRSLTSTKHRIAPKPKWQRGATTPFGPVR